MKNVIFFLILAIAGLALSACKEEPFLSANPVSISFDESGGSQAITVSANYAWTAKASGAFSISPTAGEGPGTVTVTANPASSADTATGSVTFISEGLSASVELFQAGKSTLSVGSGFTAPFAGGAFTVDVQYNVNLKVVVEPSATWLRFVQTKALDHCTLHFSVDPNGSLESRTGHVIVCDIAGKASEAYIEFVQEGMSGEISVVSEGLIPGEGGLFAVEAQHNVHIRVETSESWLKYSGESDGKLFFNADYNFCPERKAVVKVYSEDGLAEPVTIELTQSESRFRHGLMEIYNAMDGPNWKHSDGWGTDAPMYEWNGVFIRKFNGEMIAGLNLVSHQMKGSFPDCFEDFADCLKSFYFSELEAYVNNDSASPRLLVGTLPPSFAKLTKLEDIRIAFTSLTSLPDLFYDMPNLMSVDIQHNDYLTGPLPEGLGKNEGMESLHFRYNAFTGAIPDSWYKNIEVLWADYNHLAGIYPDLGDENFRWLEKFAQMQGYGMDATGRPFKAYWRWDYAKDVITGEKIPFWDIIKSKNTQ